MWQRLVQVALLCLGCSLCSLIYAFRQAMTLSLEHKGPGASLPLWRQLGEEEEDKAGWTHDKGKARMGRMESCKNVSVSYWNSYWKLSPNVCGKNCFWEAACRYNFLKSHPSKAMHLAVVACGERLETITMLRSAFIFSIRPLQFHIFAEDQLHHDFRETLDSLAYQEKFNYALYSISFPTGNASEWKKLFKPCASQRLFLPLILSDVDSLLYVDTDIVFLRPVDDIWSFLKKFNSSQIAAMTHEREEPRIGWYNCFARHPYYGKTGINSGVMLMNITRIRRKYFKNDMTTVRLWWEQILMPRMKKI